MLRALVRVTLLTGIALAAATPAASADSYCVPPATGCTVDGLPTVQAALDAAGARAGADTVRLGAATYTGQFSSAAVGDLEIVGAGAELTRLATASGNALTLGAVSGSLAVRRLGLRITGGVATRGLKANFGSGIAVEDVVVDQTGSPTSAAGLFFDLPATVTRTVIDLGGGTCVYSGGAGVSLDQLQLDNCALGVNVQGGTLSARRLRVASPGTGVQAGAGATVTVDDSLIRAPSGLVASAYAAFRTTLTGRHVTLSSANVGTALTAFNFSTNPASDARVVLRDSIASGYIRAVERSGSATAGQGTATVQTVGNDFFPSISSTQSGQGPTWTSAGNLNVAPGFVSPVDFRLAATSPLLNLRTAALGADEPTFDLNGLQRTVNGARDLGAYERQTAIIGVPTGVTATTATLNAVAFPDSVPLEVAFDYGQTVAYGSRSATTEVPAGATPVAVATTITGLTPATTYHVRATTSSIRGTAGTADVTFTTAAAPVDPGGPAPGGDPAPGGGPGPAALTPDPPGLRPGPGPGPAPGLRTLRLTALRAVPGSFRASRSTSLRFTASVAGRARLSVRREAAGRRRGRACVTRAAAPRRARRCTRLVSVPGSRLVAVKAGANRLTFRAPGVKRLRPGRYVLRLVPVAGAGQVRGPAVTVRLTVRR